MLWREEHIYYLEVVLPANNPVSVYIADRNIVDNFYDLYHRSNWVISDFRVCDSSTLDSLHRTYRMHMYGCELWDLNRNYVKDFKIAWRKIKCRIWKLSYRTHNAIVHNLSYNLDFQIETRMIKFIHSYLNHSNIICESIVLSNFYSVNSTVESKYKYLLCKYGISHDDWYTNLSQLVEKVNMKCHEDIQDNNAVLTVVELCDTLSYNDVCKLIDLISLE